MKFLDFMAIDCRRHVVSGIRQAFDESPHELNCKVVAPLPTIRSIDKERIYHRKEECLIRWDGARTRH